MIPPCYPTRSFRSFVAAPGWPRWQLAAVVALLIPLFGSPAQAQGPTSPASSVAPVSKGRLTGRVVNEKTGLPVEFATVALLDEAGSKTLDGTVCDDQGRFGLAKITAGRYRVVVSFVGFQPRTVTGVVVAANEAVVALDLIKLTPTVQQLGEVKVTGERELVENKVDRLVYNAEKDITNSGGTASDVLQKVPLLTVDLTGNLQLRGSSNIRVLVNGKPSAMMASNLAEALKQIPADQIKSVEVITSPSAKYDAEGSAGIVNIILKKNNLEGLNGSENSAVGTRGSFHSLTLNSRRGPLGLNANVGANLFYNVARNDSRRTDFLPEGQQSVLEQRGDFTNLGGGGYGQLGLDYDLTPRDALNLSVRGNVFGYTNARSQFTRFSLPTAPVDEYNRDIDTHNGSQNLDVNFGYVRTLPRPRQELSFLALYTVNTGDTDYNLAQQRWTDGRDYVDYRENSFNDNRNRETTFQADYVQPLDSTQTVEVGLKTILRNVSSDYRVEADSLDGRSFVLVPSRSNNFRYDQNVYASYLSYGFALGKTLTFKVGGRLEHTRIDGDFRSDNTTLRTNYTNLVPSLQAAWDVTKDQKLKLSYTRRIQRPSIYYLNPYLNTSNPRNIVVGNPTLAAELTDAYELGFNTYVRKSSFTFSAYSRQTNNAIEAVARTVAARDIMPTADSTQLLFTTFQNVARNATYGLSVSGSTKLTPKWTLSGNVNYYYVRVQSPALSLSNDGTMHNANITSAWQFDKGWSAQFTGLFNSRRIQLQGRSSGYRSYNVAVKKELFQKKGSLTLAVINPFNRQLVFRNDLATDRFAYTDNSYFLNRNLRLSFSYQFGKLDNRPARPKKSIRNDDQKEGGGNG
ncbi:outer membrane beta-barrel family protein [Hymenobacter chitinivorans]|uniref:Outer membrane receptor for ferrienterochelin and colicin n=1 Tax=Hymenobacter chitinivorans DSM 11115 TaxID=1121954 RepID=A0A2M9BTB6_9BACT|nr:outer membrane beta-barrel family protein [Hymenobacter chitinivorans]PJJ61184.1 outer membrane receptor for ferrienterochelin and colicin [Hymenobacter chitinivorans DSM 11115]